MPLKGFRKIPGAYERVEGYIMTNNLLGRLSENMAKRTFLSIGLACALFGSGIYAATDSNATAQETFTVSAAAPAKEEKRPTVASAAVAAASAGLKMPANKLARDIEWQFGGKTQRGWYLYTSLIQTMVGTDADPDSSEFSSAVATWKKNTGMTPTPDVDTTTWLSMMTRLQKARRGDSAQPPVDELVQTPAALWLYPDRPAALRNVRRDAFEAYERMVADARAELGNQAHPDHFKLVSGHRSADYQKQLRANAGNPTSTAGLAKNSPHFSGRAIDLYVGGEPVSTKDANRAIQVATPAYKWLAKNAHKYGFRPYFYEPWHWEFDPTLAAQAR
jgi:zinc D-Ala-D-Ala carboxypeptidase